MATLREIIYDIKEHLNVYSDDQKFSDEHLAFIIHNKRNMLLKQYMSNLKKEVPLEAMQVICMPLTLDDNCFEDITVLKSDLKIPSSLENTGRSNIVKAYVGLKFAKNVNIIDYSRIPYVASQRFASTQLFIAIDPNNYVIVFNSANRHKFLKQIELEGVYENPEEAYNMSCENLDNDCEFFDTKYPIEAALIDPLKSQIVQELTIKYKIPRDESNNGEDIMLSGSETNAKK